VKQLLRSLWLRSSYAHEVTRTETNGLHTAVCVCGWESLNHASRQELTEEIAKHAGWTSPRP
jgi:hypothetical protein